MSAGAAGDEVDALLEQGLQLYGRGEEAGAIAAWRSALELDPSNPQALDYLDAAGVRLDDASNNGPGNSAAIGRELISSAVDKQAVLDAVRERDYDRALRLLYDARQAHPEDASISRSIRHIKEHLIREMAEQLGDLDRVPEVHEVQVSATDQEASLVARLVDGIATLGDIVEVSPLGRYRTLHVLTRIFPDARQRSSEGPVSKPQPSFDALFREATLAYLRGDYAAAQAGFERCAELRPDDQQVQHNLARLRARTGA